MGYAENRRKELKATATTSYAQRRKQELNAIEGLKVQKAQALAEKNAIVESPKAALDIKKVMDYTGIKPKPELDKLFEKQAIDTQLNSKLQFPINGAPKKAPENFVGKIPAPIATGVGFADTTTMGTIEATANRSKKPEGMPDFVSEDNIVKNFIDAAKAEHPWAYMGGQAAGYFVPGAAIERGTGTLLKGAMKGTSKFVGKLATGSAAGGAQELTEGVIRNLGDGDITLQDFRDIGKRTATGTVLGGAGDVALSGIGAGGKKLINKFATKEVKSIANKEVSNLTNDVVNGNLGAQNLDNINTNPIPQKQPTMANKSIAEDIGLKKNNVSNNELNVRLDEPEMNGTDFNIRNSNERGSVKGKFETAYSKIVDTNSPIKRVGDDPFIKATNSKKAGGTVDYILKEGLTDMGGNTVGKSLQEINKSIPKGKENEFWQYMLHKLNPQRLAQDKKLGNVSAETSAKRVAEFETANPQFKTVAQDVREFIDTFMDEWGVKSGLISKDAMAEMRATYPDYIPTQRFFDEIEKSSGSMGKRSFVDQTSGIKSAKGSDRDILNPLENIMNMVNKTVRSAKFNEVGQSLLDAVRTNSKVSEIAEILPTQEGMFTNLDNVVSVLEDGKPVYLKIHDKNVLDAMKQLSSPNLQDWQQYAKKATNLFKSLITTKNPLFAVRNMFRDIPTSYIYGSTANPVKFTKDLLVAAKDVATNSKAYKQYKALGGQGGNFFNVDDITKTARQLEGSKWYQKVGDGIEWFNNLTESAPRLAEFKRTLAKTGDANKALYQAGEVTTNFSRGGNVTKQLDSFTPYLNAGVQGLDRLFRSIDIRNPKQAMQTLLKGGIAITVPTVFFEYINRDNENYKTLDNRTKDNYFLIPNGDTFIKIPKSREFGVLFSTLFQRLYRAKEGDSKAFKGFGNTIATNFAPANPVEDNIFSGITGLKNNKDFANRDIVPQSMQNLPNRLQRDEKTSVIATGFADAANELSKKLNLDKIGLGFELSPKQINYLIDSYTGVVGDFVLPATTPKGGTGAQNIKEKLLSPAKSAFTADPLYNNQAVTDFYDNLDDITKIANARNIDEGIDSKVLTEEEKTKSKLTKASKELTEINKKIKELSTVGTDASKEEIKRLRAKYLSVAAEANKYYDSIKK